MAQSRFAVSSFPVRRRGCWGRCGVGGRRCTLNAHFVSIFRCKLGVFLYILLQDGFGMMNAPLLPAKGRGDHRRGILEANVFQFRFPRAVTGTQLSAVVFYCSCMLAFLHPLATYKVYSCSCTCADRFPCGVSRETPVRGGANVAWREGRRRRARR